MDLFSPSECVEYMDASDRARPIVIRTNTLKISRKELMEALVKRGIAVEEVEWSKVAIKVTESSVPIGATPEYLAGFYMLQSAASMNPVMALDPQPGERVLDMSSAPGGKTSYIAQLMKNSGTVVANDLKPQRQKATVANLHRMGVKNSIISCYDGRKIPGVMKGFDRVLLDAPCSGLGVIAKDQSVKLQRTVKDIQRNAHLQKELLCAAVDAVDPKSPTGGIIVYSTCSVSIEENEQVVQYILQKRHVVLVDTGLQVGKPGYTRHKERRFHPSLALTRRFYPHVHNMDGFYVAKLRKIQNGVREVDDEISSFETGEKTSKKERGAAETPSEPDEAATRPDGRANVEITAKKETSTKKEAKDQQKFSKGKEKGPAGDNKVHNLVNAEEAKGKAAATEASVKAQQQRMPLKVKDTAPISHVKEDVVSRGREDQSAMDGSATNAATSNDHDAAPSVKTPLLNTKPDLEMTLRDGEIEMVRKAAAASQNEKRGT